MELSMIKENIEEQRERLHSLIRENANQEEILKASEELDRCINEFIFERAAFDKINIERSSTLIRKR